MQNVTLFTMPDAATWDPSFTTTDINDSGTIVGYYDAGEPYMFIRQNNGAIAKLDPPGGVAEAGNVRINAAGTILGSYVNLALVETNFLLDSRGNYTTITVPGSENTYPAAINSFGTIVGTYSDAAGSSHYFLRSASGAFTTFDAPGEPAGINSSDTIVGVYTDKIGYHGFLRNAAGEITKFNVPGSPGYTDATAINDRGEITGFSRAGSFIRDSAGNFTIFPLYYTFSINQEGDVCGQGPDGESVIRYADGKMAELPNFGDFSQCVGINSSRTVAGFILGEVYGFVSQPLSTIDFSSGFSSASESVNLKGSAAVNGSQLMLTNGADSEASSAFYGYPVDIRSFTTDFTFVSSDAVADGLTFTIQNDDPSAVGFPGAGLGYQRIDKSVAIKFDFHNNFGEGSDSTGLYLNGVSPTIPAIDLSHTGINLASGDPMKVHVSYDSASVSENLTLTITDDFTMDTWSKTFTVDIPGTVGATTAYVGFTASTGEKTSTLAISSWTYQAATATP